MPVSAALRMSTPARYLALAALLAAVPACKRAQATQKEAAPAVKVTTEKVSEVDAPQRLRLTGTLRGMREADLAANASGRVVKTLASGRVVKTLVERGDEVKAGSVVAQLDTSTAALSLAEAKVAVATSRTQEQIAKTECERWEKLHEKGVVSPAEYDQVTAKCKTTPLGLELAEARQNIVAKNIGDGIIRAPFAGVVAERLVDVGEYVQASSKVVTIAQVAELRLELTIPEANLAQVKRGADVSFSVAAYPGKTFHGTLRYLSGSVRATTRDLVAEAVVPNDEMLLRPGMFADVAVVVGAKKLPSVPKAAVFQAKEKSRVFVVEGGRLVERVLAVQAEVDGQVAASDGVRPGELVVVSDPSRLVNGTRVD
jgi:membrane fusion protein, multidrug efflux system